MAQSHASKRTRARTGKTRPAKLRPLTSATPKMAPAARRAAPARGVDTRAQLIEAALDVFGRLGYEGASTREIAKAADANLAAIVYHFGGKEGLHIAVAQHIAESIGGGLGPVLAAVSAPDTATTPKMARAALHRLIETFADVMLGSAQAERWARFIVREQMQPTAAFDVIYRFLGGAAGTATRLVAAALQTEIAEETQVRAFTMMGQVLVFRVAQAVILRRTEWKAIGDDQRALIKRIVLSQIDNILDAAQKSGAKS
jgi:AcrR family transcriptional regulator